jgi:hypothetical protein
MENYWIGGLIIISVCVIIMISNIILGYNSFKLYEKTHCELLVLKVKRRFGNAIIFGVLSLALAFIWGLARIIIVGN